ncbi:unnamed protein product [Rotaria socialis]|uniref:Uncharacterized protein n=1 Tax=Rotaria socialis TaxID=392032 RepID=A0A818Z273_9BILA|nr:unnamed protein product [Rotaria socialis]
MEKLILKHDIDAQFEYEASNNNLELFDENLIWNNKTLPLKNDNVLLRGTRLRNAHWAFGIVCYAGPDTKLMKNTGTSTFKRSRIDRLLNKIFLGIACFLAIMCTITTICCDFWESVFGFDFRKYPPWKAYVSTDKRIGSLQNSLLVFLSYIIIFNRVMPISLSVSIEFIRLLQSKWIDLNIKMYYEPNNVPALARTTALNEELGQVGYIFSDKIGTLTQKTTPTDYESTQTVNSKNDHLSKDEADFRQTSMHVAQETDPLLLSLNNES